MPVTDRELIEVAPGDGADPTPGAPGPGEPVGSVWVGRDGTPVGVFHVLLNRDGMSRQVEIGSLLAADTPEGTVIGAVEELRAIGAAPDPLLAEAARAAGPPSAWVSEAVMATCRTWASPMARPTRGGPVRFATPGEILAATGQRGLDWPVPVGVLPTVHGPVPVNLDGRMLAGPDAAHVIIGGMSGAAKSSFAMVLLRSLMESGRRQGLRVGALVFNVKGDDLLGLDREPEPGYELSDDDRAMWAAMGVPAPGPFGDVIVYTPGDAGTVPDPSWRRISWTLPEIYRDLELFFPFLWQDEKLAGLVADLQPRIVGARATVNSLDHLVRWLVDELSATDESGKAPQYVLGHHHRATVTRFHRMMESLSRRTGGLVCRGSTGSELSLEDLVDGRVVVVDAARLRSDIQGVLVARTLRRVMDYAESGRLNLDHLVVFFDEANMYAPATGGEQPVRDVISRVATQGRYANVSMILAAQKPSRVHELILDNCATRVAGRLTDSEVASGAYGRLPGGVVERVTTLVKGEMALWHPTLRASVVVRFPRPSWRTGAARTGARRDPVSVLGGDARTRLVVSQVPGEVLEEVMATSETPEEARRRLERHRRPDPTSILLSPPPPDDGDIWELD